MIPYKSLISIDKNADTPVYLQIANGIIQSIRHGHLRRGVKLPGARPLASTLGVHRKTLQTALDELVAQGWLEILQRKGTFIANTLPELNPVKISPSKSPITYPQKTIFSIPKNAFDSYSLDDFQNNQNLLLIEGFPDVRLAPMRELMREMRRITYHKSSKKYFQYGNPQGSTRLRESLSSFLSDTRGLPISPENIIITNGAQMGLYLTANLLLKPGDNVIVGEPGYRTATLTLERTGAIINSVTVDDNGIDVNAIESLCKKKKIRLVYVIPHHHHPTTVTLTPERRIRLLNLAASYKFALIEDDYDYDFHYASSPMLPMASLDRHGNVIYIGTLSKTLVPAIRIGFIAAPKNFIDEATQLRRSIEFYGNSLMEISLAELYRNGIIANHIKKTVKIYHERRDHFCNLLKDKIGKHVSFKIPEGGMSVWAKFIDADLSKIARYAAQKGVTMSDGSNFNKVKIYNATRLGFSSLNFDEQDKALNILKNVISKH